MRLRVAHLVADCSEDLADPQVVAGVDVGQLGGVVAAASPPGDVAEVGAVVDAVVVERREQVLLQGIPQSQFDGHATVEPPEDVEGIGPFGRGCQTEQMRRPEVVEQRRVGGRGGVVELVDDHHVELLGVERFEVTG